MSTQPVFVSMDILGGLFRNTRLLPTVNQLNLHVIRGVVWYILQFSFTFVFDDYLYAKNPIKACDKHDCSNVLSIFTCCMLKLSNAILLYSLK